MLTFLRHAETTWNREGRIQGTLDIPLSTRGRCSAEKYAAHLQDAGIRVIWTSPLERARDTATILATRLRRGTEYVPVRELGTLVERDYGILQGKRLDDLNPSLLVKEEERISGNGVEPWHGLQRRVRQALQVIVTGPSPSVIVVHGGWWKALNSLLQTGYHHENAKNLSSYCVERAELKFLLDKIHMGELCDESTVHK